MWHLNVTFKLSVFREVSGFGLSGATYRRAQVIHTPLRTVKGGADSWSGFLCLPRCHTDKSSGCRQVCQGDEGLSPHAQLKLPPSLRLPRAALQATFTDLMTTKAECTEREKVATAQKSKRRCSGGFIISLQLLPKQYLDLALPRCYDNGQSPLCVAQASSSPSPASYCSSFSSSWPLVVTGSSHANESYEACAHIRVHDRMCMKVCLSVLVCCIKCAGTLSGSLQQCAYDCMNGQN